MLNFPIEVKLKFGRSVIFRNLDHVKSFFSEEIDFGSELIRDQQYSKYKEPLDILIAILSQLDEIDNDGAFNAIMGIYRGLDWPHYGSAARPKAEAAIASMREESLEQAIRDKVATSKKANSREVRNENRTEELSNQRENSLLQLSRSVRSTRISVSEIKNRIDTIESTIDIHSIDADLKSISKHYKVLLRRMTRKGFRTYRKTVDEFASIKRTYLESMELQAPIQYWEAKAKQHEQKVSALTKYLGLAACGVIALPIIALWAASWGLLPSPNLPSDAPDWAKVAASAKGIVAAILFSGVAVWGLRILSKIYLSERHLAQDARERVTMITTYLALIKEKGAPEGERGIILQAIFRSTADGIVKDDGNIDPSAFGLLSKLLEKR